MNCFLLSGGLFQIYSNPVDYFISYEDICRKALVYYSSTHPNLTTTFNKYYNTLILPKNENLEIINREFLNDFNLYSEMSISVLFEDRKNNF